MPTTTARDLFWAARGAGPGFFAVVTRFHLRLHPWPETAMNSVYLYPGELLDAIFTGPATSARPLRRASR